MSEVRKPSCYWVLAKRIEDSRWMKLQSSDLFELTGDFQYWKFSPDASNDFEHKKAYGRIETRNKEKWMYHHYILFMSGEF